MVSSEATFTFIGELEHFLPLHKRGASVVVTFQGRPSLKHMIEDQGVPHTQAGLVWVNGTPVGLDYHLQPGDRVEVHPVAPEGGPEKGEAALGGDTDGAPRFILDNHLGRLAVYLRMLGFDCRYRNDYQDEELAQVASQEGRILLTRDRHLLMRKIVSQGYWCKSQDPRRQLLEVVQRYNLAGKIEPFKHCLRCNTPLQTVAKEAVIGRLQPLTIQYFNDFAICPGCQQIYWKGTHYEHMQGIIAEVMQQSSSSK
jgi:uncharacterized protein